MGKKNMPNFEWIVLIIMIIVIPLFWLQMRDKDIAFCRSAFADLVKARQSVQKMIDWGNLKAVGVDVGATYSSLRDEQEKRDYKKSFIKNFSHSFRQSKGKLAGFSHWRIYDKDIHQSIVAADYKNNTMLFTISKNGIRKLSVIQWEVK